MEWFFEPRYSHFTWGLANGVCLAAFFVIRYVVRNFRITRVERPEGPMTSKPRPRG